MINYLENTFQGMLLYMYMDLLHDLQRKNLSLVDIFTKYKLEDLKKELDEIVSNPECYQELKNNQVATDNFFSIVSQLYLIEQNRLQNATKADTNTSLSSTQFSKQFEEKVEELAKESNASNLSR